MPKFPFFRWTRRQRSSAEDRLGRIRKVLDQLDVDYPKQNPEYALSCVPPSRPPGRTVRQRLQPLRLPLKFEGPVALLEGGFELDRRGVDRNVQESAGSDLAWLRACRPEAIAAPLETALFLADQHNRGLLDLPSLRGALVVFTRLDDAPLAEHHRDLLWRAFGVPIFEQLMGWDGTVIARECEVHDGLHVEEAAAVAHLFEDELLLTQLSARQMPVVRARTGLVAEIAREHCECGSETPRLRNLSQVRPRVSAAAGGR